MSIELLLAFVLACILLGLTPGPNMSLIIGNTLAGGLGAGLTTLAGTTTGLAFLVAVAAIGMTSVMVLMSEWFDVVRWVGALYLVYLGARQLWRAWHTGDVALRVVAAPNYGGHYLQGLLVSLSNPKVMLFLGAFFPQFVDPAGNAVLQLAVLAGVFIVTLVLVDVCYTVAIARARATFDQARLRLLDGAAGVFLLLGGVALALVRRP